MIVVKCFAERGCGNTQTCQTGGAPDQIAGDNGKSKTGMIKHIQTHNGGRR